MCIPPSSVAISVAQIRHCAADRSACRSRCCSKSRAAVPIFQKETGRARKRGEKKEKRRDRRRKERETKRKTFSFQPILSAGSNGGTPTRGFVGDTSTRTKRRTAESAHDATSSCTRTTTGHLRSQGAATATAAATATMTTTTTTTTTTSTTADARPRRSRVCLPTARRRSKASERATA
ncbi:hypothetical protein ALC56_14344 [Trachymyrmex septentrionalis]|uniref:Uncharacterized protein n=1 Tax=Trachymyrmex septentrionalis TaxID=34720 RepID=A0A195ETA3_9HYME|nr:hypothetical protein ALC56_14344 [Trachymyrmex septentrionalis]